MREERNQNMALRTHLAGKQARTGMSMKKRMDEDEDEDGEGMKRTYGQFPWGFACADEHLSNNISINAYVVHTHTQSGRSKHTHTHNHVYPKIVI